jgi:hypothetical protein
VLWSMVVSENCGRASVEALMGRLAISPTIDHQDSRSVASGNTERERLCFIVPPIAYLKYLEHIFQK